MEMRCLEFTMQQHAWTIPGYDDQPILGNTHLPDGDARGAIIIAHGFKGYKDYGMFPRIAQRCAEAGFIAHRFNFSHSGMTNEIDTFARPDLFERDTFNKQVFDLHAVVQAATAAEGSQRLPIADCPLPPSLPYIIFGHSRGGVAALLTAGRYADDADFAQPAGVITAAAPDRACSLNEQDREQLLQRGWLESPSSRTGQTLRVGRDFLQEQIDDPLAHDVTAMANRIRCPLLIIHGENDPTVPVDSARRIAEAAGDNASLLIIPGGDHVFNTPNPMPDDAEASPQLAAMLSAVLEFAIAAMKL